METYPHDASYKPLDPQEAERLTKQEQAILDLFQSGAVVCNTEMAQVSLKYFTKVSSLRGRGYDIRLIAEDFNTGEAWYQMPSPIPRLTEYRVPVRVEIPGHDPVTCEMPVRAISPTSAKYRAWRAVKVLVLGPPIQPEDTCVAD